MTSSVANSIPIVDVSPFFREGDDQAGKKAAKEAIANACLTTGFFQIVNHGVPVELMSQTLDVLRAFFKQTEEEKNKLKPKPKPSSLSPVPAGYARQPENLPDKNEYYMMFAPDLGCNVYPGEPAEFRPTMDECYTQLSTLALLVGDILNDCMELPPNFIRDYIKDRHADVMVALHYVPVTNHEDIGNAAHRDGNCISFLCQDDVGGLEVLVDGEWISIDPSAGGIIVNIGDIVQVLTNNKFQSALHRVVRKPKDRYSFVYFFNTDGDTWIEPLPQFTSEIGEQPVYNGFKYKDYMQLRMRNKTHPPARPEDAIDISHYAISPRPI